MRGILRAAVVLAVAVMGASDAAAAEPVAVLDDHAVLREHDRVRLRVACLRTIRPCRGRLLLGQQQLCPPGPVGDPRCQVVIGRGRFAIPAGKGRTVTVARIDGPGAMSQTADAVNVIATPTLERSDVVGPRSRLVRLVAPVVLLRPSVPSAVTRIERLALRATGVRAYAHVPLGTSDARVDVPEATVALHQDTVMGYVTARTSFAVGGARWHGEALSAARLRRVGERVPARLAACAPAGCVTARREVVVFDDPALGPICVLPRDPRA